MSCSIRVLLMACLLGTAAFCQGARLLKENDPSTYTTVKGQTPGGFYAVSDMAEAGANGNSKGIRYNGARTMTTGDTVPSSKASAVTNLPSGNAAAKSGNLASEANVNLGLEVISTTYEGARAVAGSSVLHTADNNGAVSSTTNSFRPGTTHNKGSVAFTDTTPISAAVSGQGNGPTAIAWGNEVAAMSRSWRPRTTGANRRWDP